MFILKAAFYFTATVYVISCQFWLAYWFLGFIALYCLIATFYPGSKTISTRRKFTLATWSAPSDGIIYNNLKIRVDHILQYLQTLPKYQRPTITHYVIVACGETLKLSSDLNGKLVFGKFVPYQTCDVSCFVNIDGTQDVGMINIKDVPNKSVFQIGKQIKEKSKPMRPKGGDKQHQKRMKLLNIVPSFLIAIIYNACIFLTSYLGISVSSIGLQKDAVGSMIVSSVGNFGFNDACTSFFGTVGQWVIMTVNAVHEQPVVNDGKVEIAKMININCAIDHRYLYSGARGKQLVQIFKDVFQNPEKYTQKQPETPKND